MTEKEARFIEDLIDKKVEQHIASLTHRESEALGYESFALRYMKTITGQQMLPQSVFRQFLKTLDLSESGGGRPYLHFIGRKVTEESSTKIVITCEEFDLDAMTEFGIWFGEIKMEQDSVATPVIFAFTLKANGVPMQLLTSAGAIYQFHVFRLYIEESEAYGDWIEYMQDFADATTVDALGQTVGTLVETVDSLERRVSVLEGNGIIIKRLTSEEEYLYQRSSSDDIMVYYDPENEIYNYVRAWKNESVQETLLYSLSETPSSDDNIYTESQMLSIPAAPNWRNVIEELEVFWRVVRS